MLLSFRFGGLLATLMPCLLRLGFLYLVYYGKKNASRTNVALACFVILAFSALWLNLFLPIPAISHWSTWQMEPVILANWVVYVLLLILFIKEQRRRLFK